jgi:hypothetical protein
MKITDSVINKIAEDIAEMLTSNQGEMEAAYLRAGDDPLDIAIKVKIGEKGVKIKTISTINFVKDRCQDKRASEIDEEQTNLFEE